MALCAFTNLDCCLIMFWIISCGIASFYCKILVWFDLSLIWKLQISALTLGSKIRLKNSRFFFLKGGNSEDIYIEVEIPVLIKLKCFMCSGVMTILRLAFSKEDNLEAVCIETEIVLNKILNISCTKPHYTIWVYLNW